VLGVAKKNHKCVECGHTQIAWDSICPSCGQAGTMEEVVSESRRAGKGQVARKAPAATLTAFDKVSSLELARMETGIAELDRVLGGGLVPGTGMVLAGEPGAGKTTLASEIVINLSEKMTVAYFSGEESVAQVKTRLERLGSGASANIPLSNEVGVERICQAIDEHDLDFVVIDSIQTVFSEEVGGVPGSISQVKESAHQIMRTAKSRGTSVLIIGQVVKSGDMAGPRALEHLVDVVLSFEGDRRHQHRILRANKNRYGSTDEVGVFEMTGKGLLGVDDVSSLFIEDGGGMPGAAVTAVIEGSRPILCEIQVLASPSDLPQPIRGVRGLDPKRVQMLLAVLRRKAGIKEIGSMDIYVNVSGSLKIEDPGTDLAVCLAIASAVRGQELGERACIFGEVSLLGLVRPAPQGERRSKEADRLGYQAITANKVEDLKTFINRALAGNDSGAPVPVVEPV
jgi:DNA repair protein RadA/Sms